MFAVSARPFASRFGGETEARSASSAPQPDRTVRAAIFPKLGHGTLLFLVFSRLARQEGQVPNLQHAAAAARRGSFSRRCTVTAEGQHVTREVHMLCKSSV